MNAISAAPLTTLSGGSVNPSTVELNPTEDFDLYEWSNATGFAFIIEGQTHYGWARLTSTSLPVMLTGYAYETTPGKAIHAGQTSEDDGVAPYAGSDHSGNSASAVPTAARPFATLGMLAMGADAMPLWRRKESQ